jgi:hypothetical protein
MGNPGTSTREHQRRKSVCEEVVSDPSGRFIPPGEHVQRNRGNERSALDEAADRLGMPRVTLSTWHNAVKGTLNQPNWNLWPGRALGAPRAAVSDDPATLVAAIKEAADRPSGASLDELCEELGASIGDVLDGIEQLVSQGVSIKRIGDRYEIDRSPRPAFVDGGKLVEVMSDAKNTFCFGAVGDNHAASKYERLDVLEGLYDWFAKAGVTQVFHTGNWIDGEARFNRQDIVAFGLEGQARYLAQTYPVRPGITTYAVWGDDHEGWYTREGVDVGRYTEDVMHSEGRKDWVNLGFMEAHISLVNGATGATARMAVVHPGGGSAYATSYKPQKIIESMDGGEKPAIVLLGHYHKLEIGNARNVWYLQTGCTQDQTVFLRKKSIEAHVGGILVTLEQDPDTGAIIECNGMRRYFNRAYYTGAGNGRWSKHGPVRPLPRSPGGV